MERLLREKCLLLQILISLKLFKDKKFEKDKEIGIKKKTS